MIINKFTTHSGIKTIKTEKKKEIKEKKDSYPDSFQSFSEERGDKVSFKTSEAKIASEGKVLTKDRKETSHNMTFSDNKGEVFSGVMNNNGLIALFPETGVMASERKDEKLLRKTEDRDREYGWQITGHSQCHKPGQVKDPVKTLSSLDMEDYMIPANTGKITHVALTYGSLLEDEKENYLEVMKTYMSHMPSARFTILTGSKEEKEELEDYVDGLAKEKVISSPERIEILDRGISFSIWAQDSTLVVGNKVLSPPRYGFPGDGDGSTAEELGKALPEMKYDFLEGLFIDGGNQLATKDTLFVGSDAIDFMINSMNAYPSDYREITSKLKIENADKINQEELCQLMMEKSFPHQKIVIIGDKGRQPAFHIDMAMTPLGKLDPRTGKKVMTVGDPSMAIRILKDIKKNNPERYKEYQKNMRQKLGKFSLNPDVIKKLKRSKDQPELDKLEKFLENSPCYEITEEVARNLMNIPALYEYNLVFDKAINTKKELIQNLEKIGFDKKDIPIVLDKASREFTFKELTGELKARGYNKKDIGIIIDMAEKPDSSIDKPLDTLIREIDGNREFQENFDFLARDFQEIDGYKVERVPYLGKSFEEDKRIPWITYNNSVIDGDNIFIPNFGIPELDNPANKVYKKYGYNPVPIDMTSISTLQGALNCITKVLERTYTDDA